MINNRFSTIIKKDGNAIYSVGDSQFSYIKPEELSPKSQIAALGLIIRLLDEGQEVNANCYIISSDNTIISYRLAVDYLSMVINDLVDFQNPTG